MKGKSVLIVGCGELGARLGELLLEAGCGVTGLRRDVSALPAGFGTVAADYTEPGALDIAAAMQPDLVIITPVPAGRGDQGYRRGFTLAMENLLRGLGQHRPLALVMVSSTRVFAECDGGWVDESSALSRDDPAALAIIEAERLLLQSRHRGAVVRFGGIYGNPAGRLLSRVRRGEICSAQPLAYGNRIHREDCAGLLAHLLGQAVAGQALPPVMIGVDDLPAPRHEVERWLAEQLGVETNIQAATAGARSGHRRCSNHLLKASGYRLRYPDYRSGYRAVLELR